MKIEKEETPSKKEWKIDIRFGDIGDNTFWLLLWIVVFIAAYIIIPLFK